MSSSSETKIAVALYRRDPISTDPHKRRLYQRESYHWGILIVQGSIHDAYEATDRNTIDPVTFRQENPAQGWWFNGRQGVDPGKSGKFLGYIIIGTVPSDKSRDDVKELMEGVPLPKKNQNPQESCVTWVGKAIHIFHEAGYMDALDVERFLDWGLSYADRRLAESEVTPNVVYYEPE